MKLPLNIWFVKCEMFANPYDLIPTPAPPPANGIMDCKHKKQNTKQLYCLKNNLTG